MVRFDVSTLIKARVGTALTLSVDTGPQTLIDLEVDFLCGTIRATRVQGGLLAQGTIESKTSLECVRCLNAFSLPVTLQVEETFRLSGSNTGASSSYAVSATGWIDLTPVFREQCWLAIPMKPLCRPDCKGFCSQCGIDLNLESCDCKRERIDPRLALLKELL